jgi:CBS domain-containing protein
MKVKEIMTGDARTCAPTSNLAEVAGGMWERDCGILPVVTEEGKVVGLITDRDICMAGAMKSRHLADIAVAEVISEKVYSCAPDDDVRVALETMKDRRVRRLPVVDSEGKLEGIVTLNDMVLYAKEGAKSGLSFADVVTTYQGICARPLAEAQQVQGAGA